jgi:hypothetical protein
MSNIRFSAERGVDCKYGMCIKRELHSGQYLTLLQCCELTIGTEHILCKTAALPRFLLENTCRRQSFQSWYIIVHCMLKIISACVQNHVTQIREPCLVLYDYIFYLIQSIYSNKSAVFV